MVLNIFMFVTMYPIIFILYYILCKEGKNESDYFFGVTLSKELRSSNQCQELAKQHRKKQTRLLIIFLLIPFSSLLTRHVSIQLVIWIIWLFAYIFFMNIPFFQIHREVMTFKQSHVPEKEETTHYFEIQELDTRKTVHLMHYLPSFLINLFVCAMIFGSYLYNHQNLWDGVTISLISLVCINPICYILGLLMDRQKMVVINHDSTINLNYNRAKKQVWNRFWIILCYINTLVVLSFLLTLLDVNNIFVIFLCSSVLETVAIAVLIIFTFKKNQRIEKRYADKKEPIFQEDMDQYWIGGIYYYNPNDSHILVDKRVGVGTTTNMATGFGLFLDIIGVVTIVCTIIMCFWVVWADFTPIKLTLTEGHLICTHTKIRYDIPVDKIKNLERLEELPSMKKSVGSDYENADYGSFIVSKERCQVFLNPNNTVFYTFSVDGTTYYLSGENDVETDTIFEELMK